MQKEYKIYVCLKYKKKLTTFSWIWQLETEMLMETSSVGIKTNTLFMSLLYWFPYTQIYTFTNLIYLNMKYMTIHITLQ